MNISREKLDAAVQAGILAPDQADRLYDFLQTQTSDEDPASVTPRFGFTHVLYYFGGLVAIGAMSLFMTLGWEAFGGFGILAISLAYAGIGLWLAKKFETRGYALPAGICAAFVVALTPLAIYGLQKGLGVWPADDTPYRAFHVFIKWHWLFMELGTLAAGALALYRFRYPFLLMPVAVTLWYMSMDITMMLAPEDYIAQHFLREWVSLWFGLLVTLFAFWVDIRARFAKGDYAFWLYLFGVLAFWTGMTLQHSDSELSKFFYLLINLSLVVVGVTLSRRVFVVFGALGTCLYLGHLASDVFRDSWLFPISLTAIGLGIVWLGIFWQRHEQRATRWLRAYLPAAIRETIDARQSHS